MPLDRVRVPSEAAMTTVSDPEVGRTIVPKRRSVSLVRVIGRKIVAEAEVVWLAEAWAWAVDAIAKVARAARVRLRMKVIVLVRSACVCLFGTLACGSVEPPGTSSATSVNIRSFASMT